MISTIRKYLFLTLTPSTVIVKKNKGFTVSVIDRRTGIVIQKATLARVKTNAVGKATMCPSKAGFLQYKASRGDHIRSNVMCVIVTN